MHTKRHVLIPIDFSLTSLESVEATQDLSFPNIEITLLHVYNPIQLQGPTTRDGMPLPNGLTKDIEQNILDRLKQIRDSKLSGFKEVFYQVEVSRYPAKAICQFAASERIDLIILTTREKADFSRVVMGSVADGVVRKASCAILLMRLGRYQLEQKIESSRHIIDHSIPHLQL